jgi:transcriptional regulator with XRE-family HTH domain
VDLVVAFGLVVREERTRLGLSQKQLAELAGLHRNFVILVEQGASAIALDSVEAIAAALELKPWELLMNADLILEQWGARGTRG